MNSYVKQILLRPALSALATLLLAGVPATATADSTSEEPELIRLWPAGPPGRQLSPRTLHVEERGADGGFRDRAATGITQPALTVFRPRKSNGSALLIVPGGGYARVVMDKEGYETARWFAERGTTAFVLLYRLPGEAWSDGADVVLQDTQRAMRLIRDSVETYLLDQGQIGVMGFSAGGHAAAMLATRFASRVYAPQDEADTMSARPDFAVLMYPVISMDDGIAHAGSRTNLLGQDPGDAQVEAQSPQRHVTDTTPPVFILHAADDASVGVANSLVMHAALLEAGRATDLHVFSVGGHGFGLRGVAGLPAAVWPHLVQRWMFQLCETNVGSD